MALYQELASCISFFAQILPKRGIMHIINKRRKLKGSDYKIKVLTSKRSDGKMISALMISLLSIWDIQTEAAQLKGGLRA